MDFKALDPAKDFVRELTATEVKGKGPQWGHLWLEHSSGKWMEEFAA